MGSPRGLGRSTRKDGRGDHAPQVQADDVHAVVKALGAGPVEMFASRAGFREAYEAKGWGAGMAAFMAMSSWRGEFSDDYFAQPAPDPARFGMPTADDGSRDDPLLSDRSWAVGSYRPDVDALAAAPTRILIAVGEESEGTFTGRAAVATAELLGQPGDRVPKPPRRLPRRRVRIRRPTRSPRAQASPRPRRPHLTAAPFRHSTIGA